MQNKKGQFESMIYLVITLIVLGIILFFFNHMNKQIYDKFDSYIETSDYNGTEADVALGKLQAMEGSNIYDYVFLAIFISMVMVMLLLSFSTRINVAFFWIFIILGVVIIVVGTLLSNVWQELAGNAEFATTITRFPITNSILGSYFPMVILAVVFLGMIALFGKPPGET